MFFLQSKTFLYLIDEFSWMENISLLSIIILNDENNNANKNNTEMRVMSMNEN